MSGSLSAQIRAWMKAQPGHATLGEIRARIAAGEQVGFTAREVAEALGLEKPIRAHWLLNVMWQHDVVARSETAPFRYYQLREPAERVKRTPEEQRAHRLAQDRASYARRRDAGLIKRKAPAEPKPPRFALPSKRPQPAVIVAPAPQLQAPRVERFETVAEWMARTGQQPERLPPGQTSTPLRCFPIQAA